MRILITNDDGIDAPGIRWLARAVAHAGYEVVVAAPLSESSGSSASMTAVVQDGKICFEERELAGAKNLPAYGVAASPAY
ncbi:5'/3'-nucleotidase SurE, partial [Actinosynnema sp.]|uniref:5'/3'-nucleotidase SurE n=1 Tax=Actinosynnema sp. TaxID=1872144 RepID=UPI003F838024